jgi:mono/diheme cytochrome c family protein
MNTDISRTRWFIGIALLGAVLVFGLSGVVSNAREGDQPRYEQNALYIEECGACHLAYPPPLLPTKTWQGIMASLEDHFGDNAEMDEETTAHLDSYHERLVLQKGAPTLMSQMLRDLPDDPPLRVTEFPSFLRAHEVIAQQLDIEEFAEGFLSPCADCHREAADGIFDKDRLHPGYGPQAWSEN